MIEPPDKGKWKEIANLRDILNGLVIVMAVKTG